MELRHSRALHLITAVGVSLVCLIQAAVGPLPAFPSQPDSSTALAKLAVSEPPFGLGSQANGPYSIVTNSVTGGPESQPPTFYTNNVTVSGNVSAEGFVGQWDQYRVQVNWGDGSIQPGFVPSLSVVGNTFTGTWTSSQGHAYTQSGTYTITVALYHGQPPGADGATDAVGEPITVIVVIPPAVAGMVFNDANHNAVMDAGETGIGGVGVSITGPQNVSTSTASNGFFHFSNLAAGNYTVNETNPSGYVSTTPDIVNVKAEPGHVSMVLFGDTAADNATAFVLGTAFNDNVTTNGVWDPGEFGISGVTVTFDGNAAQSQTTNSLGQYSFEVKTSGAHLVSETDLPGYFSTTPNTLSVDVTLGNAYTKNFGDVKNAAGKAAVFGIVFNDNNGNGVYDVDETGLPGVGVTLAGATTDVTTNTLPNGMYSFASIEPGAYIVKEANPPGYKSTTPDEIYLLTVADRVEQVNFGDALPNSTTAYVYGTVFNDANKDRARQLGELGIPGVTVAFGGAATTTSSHGEYTIKALVSGNFTVSETDPVGYYSTTPNEVLVDVVFGNSYQVDFGDAAGAPGKSAIFGIVFDDTNGNGVYDAGEEGIGDVTVALAGTTANVTTLSNGMYFFANLDPASGNFTVSETDPAGYYSTTSNKVVVEVLPGNSYQRDFGDALLSTCTLTISPKTITSQLPGTTTATFTVSLKDKRGIGLPGFQINLSATFGTLNTRSVTTGASGTASFTISSSTSGNSNITATLGTLSDTATSIWLPAPPAPPGGGGGGPPPSPTPSPTPTPTPPPTTAPATPTPEPVLYFRVDFLGRVTMAPMSKDGRLLEQLDALSPDGTHSLRLPKNTLTLDKQGKIVNAIKIVVAGNVPALPAGTVVVGQACDFTPSGITFDSQVRLSLGYSVSGLPGSVSSARMGFNTPETGWVEIDTEPGVTAGVGSLTASISHFSIYAVLAKITAATPVATGNPVFGAANLSVSRARNLFWDYFPLVTVHGRDVKLSADVTNSGGQKGDWDLQLKIDGRTKGQTRVSLDAAQTRNVVFSVGGNLPGKHRVQFGNLGGEFVTVWTFNWWLLVLVFVVAAVAGWLVSVYIHRLRIARAKVRS